jgi:hypothetical protein
MINPDLERFMTKRAQSQVIELPGSHAAALLAVSVSKRNDDTRVVATNGVLRSRGGSRSPRTI